MAEPTDYITLGQLKAHLRLDAGDTEFDPQLERVITSVSAWIDEHCQRHFWQDGTDVLPVTRSFDAQNRRVLRLGEYNDLAEIDTLTVDGEVWTSAEYRLLRGHGDTRRPYVEVKAVGSKTFPLPELQDIDIAGVWGWPAVPYQVPEAGLIQSARIFKRREAPEGVLGINSFGVVRLSGRLDIDVASNLNNLIHPQAAVPVA